MGQGASSSAEAFPPPDILKLNDSMYELYCPPKGEPNLEIFFFHGLQTTESKDAHWKSWMSETDSGAILWPKEWLGQKFPRARIISVSYDASISMTATAGRQDLFNIGENFVADLLYLDNVGQGRPIVLVGHSLGGLVIKQVIMEAYKQSKASLDNDRQRRLNSLLNNIKGLFYFSTPHHGSQLLNLATGMPSGWKGLSQLMQEISGRGSERLNEAFRIWRKNRKDEIRAFSIGETHATLSRRRSFGRQSSIIVVPESSARYDTDGYLSVASDHFEISKPKLPVSSSFQALTRFISAVTGVPVSTFQMDSHNVATGMPVEMPDVFNTSITRPSGSDPVEGIPVKAHGSGPGKGLHVKIDVPEDDQTFFEQFADKWQGDIVNNYCRPSSELPNDNAARDGFVGSSMDRSTDFENFRQTRSSRGSSSEGRVHV